MATVCGGGAGRPVLNPPSDPEMVAMAALAAAALVAGIVRGFSGFGAAMIFMPVAGALWDPRAAVVMILVFDNIAALPLVRRALPLCAWRDVLPMAAGAAIGLPIGARLLAVADPHVLRWAIGALILATVVAMALRLRPRLPESRAAAAGVGAASGLAGGSTGLSGPPVVLFWLSGDAEVRRVRANILVFFALSGALGIAALGANGLLTGERVAAGAALLPVYAIGMYIGARRFAGAGERGYRRVALGLCALAAVAGLPVW